MRFLLRYQKAILFAFVLFLPFVLMAPGLYLGETLFLEDIANLYYPINSFFYQMASEQSLSFWNPYIFSGFPLEGYFYPLGLLFYLIPTLKAMVYFVLLHLLLGIIFAFIYFRSLKLGDLEATVGALVFGLSGFLLSETRHFTILAGAVYLPLLFLCWEKSRRNKLYLPLLVLALTLQILAGSPQIVFISLLALGFKAIWEVGEVISEKENRLKFTLSQGFTFLYSIIFSLGLSTFYLLPFYQSFKYFGRHFHQGLSFANTFALNIRELLVFFLPELFSPVTAQGLVNYYLGFFALLPALAGIFYAKKERFFFLFLLIFALWAALGEKAGLNPLLVKFLPFYGFFRAPARFLLLAVFSLAVFSVWGAKWLFSGKNKWPAFLFTLLLGLELVLLGKSALPFTGPDYYREPQVFSDLKQDKSHFRLLTTPETPFHYINWSIPAKLFSITGYFPTVPYYYLEYLWANDLGSLPEAKDFENLSYHSNSLSVVKWETNQMKLLNLKYVVAADEKGKVFAFKVKGSENNQPWFLAGDYLVIPDKLKLLKRINSPGFKPFEQVIFQQEPDLVKSGKIKGEIQLLSYSPAEIKLKVASDKPAILVLSEIDFPGWQAEVDGKAGKILRADYIFRALALEAGSHQVVFSYTPPHLKTGLICSLVFLLVFLLDIFRRLRKSNAV